MSGTSVRVTGGQMPATATTLDVTIAGETRNPTGCIVMTSDTSAGLDSTTANRAFGFGVTDFTTSAAISGSSENNVDPTDCHTRHQETYPLFLIDNGVSTTERSASAAAISGGVQFTFQEAGTTYYFTVILIFGSVCKAFSSGASTADTGTFDVAHGMSSIPGAGIYGYSPYNVSDGVNMQFGLGFHAYDGSIEQAAWGMNSNSGQTTTDINARVLATRVAFDCTVAAAENEGVSLSSVDGTNCTYTAHGALSGDLIGLLIECDDCSSKVDIIDSPTDDTVDWDYTGLTFQPQFTSIIGNRIFQVDNGIDDTNAGAFGYYAGDEDGNERSVAGGEIDGRDTTISQSFSRDRQATDFFVMAQGGAASVQMANIAFNETGWTFAAADIETGIDTTVRKWPMLAIEQGGSTLVQRVLRSSVAVTDPQTGYEF